ncbi:MAG: hypothetical protein KDB94_11270 [Acidobacteria bacterium]|nr:hypothetical protein [Acidobacteriota bacterium]
MKSLPRLGAALLAFFLAVLVAAPLPAARCKVGTGEGCPMMRGAEGSFCHRDGAMSAPMDCCKTKGSSAPAPASDAVGPAAPQAVLAESAFAAVTAVAMLAPPAESVAPLRAAESLHRLGLFTLIEVFRN